MTVLVHLPHEVSAFQVQARHLDALRAAFPGREVREARDEPEFLKLLPQARIAVVWRFSAEWYARAPKLGDVCTPAAGRESVAPDPSGRVRVHHGAFHGPIMAETLLAMVLFMKRRLGDTLDAQRAHRWDRSIYDATTPLAGEVALIVGFGAIGGHCARALRALGVVVHGLRRDASRPEPLAERLFAADALLDAVALADHVVCILPSDTGTDRLLGRAAFERMKPTTFVYNIGRGNAVDVDALTDALVERRIGGAFLDVFPEEPLGENSALWDVPNLFVMPHASAARADYLDRYFAELLSVLRAESG